MKRPLILVPVGIVLLLAAYFVAPGSTNRRSLSHSLQTVAQAEPSGGTAEARCERTSSDAWDCSVALNDGSSIYETHYLVDTKEGWGCWTAVQDSPKTFRLSNGQRLPEELEGCVKLGDNIRIWSRLE